MIPVKHTFQRTRMVGALILGSAARLLGATSGAPEPEVSLSLRGLSDHSIEVGVPLFASVRIDAPSGPSAPFVIAPTHGTWVDMLRVELITNDDTVRATARAVSNPDGSAATLDADHGLTGLWQFSGETLAAAGAGAFRVRARLEIRDGNGWKGECFSTPVAVHLVAPSENTERKVQNALARAQAAIVDHRLEEAARILDGVLEREPDHVALLKLRAMLCLNGGDVVSAQRCVRRARVLVSRGEGHPSVELHELASLVDQAEASMSDSSPRESWTRPPASVLAPLNLPSTDLGVASRAPTPNASPAVPAEPVQAVSLTAATAVPAPAPAPVARAAAQSSGPPSIGLVVPAAELADASILAETAGQWAASATAGSQYDRKQYAAAQATGAPNIKVAGNSPDAWSPAKKNDGTEWLEVAFTKPVRATEVRIRQNDTPACIAKIEALEPDGTTHVWWEGVDPYVVPAVREIVWFGVRVPKTTYLVAKIRITLNLAAVSGWKEIDAVQLVGGD